MLALKPPGKQTFMRIKPTIKNFKLPTRNSENAGGYDLYMPTAGFAHCNAPEAITVNLGFKCALPEGCVGLIIPRSGAGGKRGASLNNIVGLIDQDYRGDWKIMVRNRNKNVLRWEVGDSLFQLVIVQAFQGEPELLGDDEELDDTVRGEGGFGSTDIDVDLSAEI